MNCDSIQTAWDEFFSALVPILNNPPETDSLTVIEYLDEAYLVFMVDGVQVRLKGDPAERFYSAARAILNHPAIKDIASLHYVEKAIEPVVGKIISDIKSNELLKPKHYLDLIISQLKDAATDWSYEGALNLVEK